MSKTPATDWYSEPDDFACFTCGDEGFVHDCFDGFCESAEDGCDDCTLPCPNCSKPHGPTKDVAP